jgi:hypothetical protein
MSAGSQIVEIVFELRRIEKEENDSDNEYYHNTLKIEKNAVLGQLSRLINLDSCVESAVIVSPAFYQISKRRHAPLGA